METEEILETLEPLEPVETPETPEPAIPKWKATYWAGARFGKGDRVYLPPNAFAASTGRVFWFNARTGYYTIELWSDNHKIQAHWLENSLSLF